MTAEPDGGRQGCPRDLTRPAPLHARSERAYDDDMRKTAFFFLLVAISMSGCDSRTTPPERTSPAMSAIRVDFGALSVRSRGGVTFGLNPYSARPPVERYEAGGRRITVYPSESGTAYEFCVIDED